ncbi:glycosyltransferase family 4 protein [Sulfitobacter sp. Ks41]|uniref:glycosyltransferase family 4 protein n=1 Tax=Sulfitobacter sp. Ks41 TaxID=2731139 RepID=UPI0023E350ED|nr:glycosyltransferase family 4 protein [Sulfitobacter sp. Ks41]MDF3362853.1 glycosyltransferase family 4 protein [Sulfitobacter sp. Ks41]
MNHSISNFLLIEGTDFTRPIYGSGNATVVSSIMRGFAGRVSLVGVTSEPSHVLGKWTTVEAFGNCYNFLPIAASKQMLRPVTRSSNLDLALALYKYRGAIQDAPTRKVLTRTYSILWALNKIPAKWDVCFYFPGLGNPMLVGRKASLTKHFAKLYSYLQARALRKYVTMAYAAASASEVHNYNSFLTQKGVQIRVQPLPTAVDTSTVHPFPKEKARSALSFPQDALIICFVGRLAKVKGIPLLIDAFRYVREQSPREALFLLAGDGELRPELEANIAKEGLSESVHFLGMLPKKDLVKVIATSDVCVVGSYTEGFSNAMLEQLAVGKPIVSTDVSGASDIIRDGVNGFIVTSRDPNVFGRHVIEAAKLTGTQKYNLKLVREKYSEAIQWRRISDDWLDRT